MKSASTAPWVDHEDATIASFQHDLNFAAEYLNAVIADGDLQEIDIALHRLARMSGKPKNSPRKW